VTAQRFALDSSYRRPDGAMVIIGGSPLRMFTLSPGGRRVIEAIERGEPLTGAHAALTDRLLDAGVIHPVNEPVDANALAPRAAELTIVVPAFNSAPLWFGETCRMIVVDDASPTPITLRDLGARSPGRLVELIRLGRNLGPGGARNAGLARVTTPFVAFVDSDVEMDERALLALLAHFDDPRVALVGPRITASTSTGTGTGISALLARFERTHSPLDLGLEPARIAPTTRVSYVPAAVIVCRTEALRAVGGFDESLRFGEDVDLVWRLHGAGWRCRYEPTSVACHRTRTTVRSWLTQRFGYGTSAAPLAARHPGALAPVRMSGWSAATWAPVLAGVPMLGVLIAGGTALALVRKLRTVPPLEALRLAGLGNLYAGRLLAATLTRAWWPVAAVAALCSRRARRIVFAAAAVTLIDGWRRERPEVDPLRYSALRIADDLAYGAGVWSGSWRERRLDALLPSFEAWPPRA